VSIYNRVVAADSSASLAPTVRARLATEMADPASEVGASLSDTYAAAKIAPYLTPLNDRAEPLRIAMIQDAPSTVYATWSRTGEVPRLDKTVDGGLTWTTLVAALPAMPAGIVKLVSATLVMVEETSTTTVGGSNPGVWRSTDDGATWASVAAGLKFPPLSNQGICEGSDGSVMIGEYGNVGTQAYRIMRSTDDGVTWGAVYTTAGTEPAGDPGHIHSITYDPIGLKHVAFSDRPYVDGVSGPKVLASSDNGATWVVLGESTSLTAPNFVTPMFFSNYIAWGSDNQINGEVRRMLRSDFYAGNFDKTEFIAQLDQKAIYHAFPVRSGVWLMSQNVEHISSPSQNDVLGSYASTVFVVDEEGSRVSGGIESYYGTTAVGTNPGVRARFPSRKYDVLDFNGFCWVTMPVGTPRAYMATPVSQGWAPPTLKTLQTHAIPFLKRGVRFDVERPSGRASLIDSTTSSYTTLGPNVIVGTNAEVRLQDSGDVDLYSGGSQRLSLPASGGYVTFPQRLDLAPNQIGVRAGGSSPEGSMTAPVGTIFVTWNGGLGTTLWIKESGGGNTGWVPVGRTTPETTTNIGAASNGINTVGKYQGRPAFNKTSNRPVWASGAAATDPWLYADGTTATTPV